MVRVRHVPMAVEIVCAYAATRWSLRRRDLPTIVAGVRSRDSVGSGGTFDEPARIARAMSRVLRRLPGDTRCLTRSVVLGRLLARRGIAFTLVIGVRPGFAAHAWVEHGGRALLPPGDNEYERLVEL